jgi:hypothetical protein
MILAVIVFVAAIVAKLVVDYNKWEKGEKVDHNKEAWYAAGVATVLTIIGGLESLPMWVFLGWTLFDILFALTMGQKWDYVGDTSQLDKLQRKYPFLKYAKYSLAILSVIFQFL